MKNKYFWLASIIALALLALPGCNSTGVYQAAAETNDSITEMAINTLCSPTRLPALQRRFSNNSEALQCLVEICPS